MDAQAPRPTANLTAGVLSLEREAEQEGLSVADNIALQDAAMRQAMSKSMGRVFGWANGVTLVVTIGLVVLDECNIRYGLMAPSDRIVTQQVLMALLGATTVQVGGIAVIMARYLFPVRSRDW